uniref:Uncharacterized protein n=1 Tax=Arundo donax TaxID=35708 RepID=A0A0A9FBB7_ARUDO
MKLMSDHAQKEKQKTNRRTYIALAAVGWRTPEEDSTYLLKQTTTVRDQTSALIKTPLNGCVQFI